MLFCKNCGAQLQEDMNFCNCCGAPVEAPVMNQTVVMTQSATEVDQTVVLNEGQTNYQPQNVQPTAEYQQPYQPQGYEQPPVQPYAPVTPQPQKMTVAGRVMGIISMILGIEGLITGIIIFFYSIAIIGICASASYYGIDEAAFLAGTVMGVNIIGIAIGIVTVILAGKARAKGNTSVMPKLGKGFGIPTIILSALGVFFTIIAIGCC